MESNKYQDVLNKVYESKMTHKNLILLLFFLHACTLGECKCHVIRTIFQHNAYTQQPQAVPASQIPLSEQFAIMNANSK